eukprot:775157-Amphidinium_carterae.1
MDPDQPPKESPRPVSATGTFRLSAAMRHRAYEAEPKLQVQLGDPPKLKERQYTIGSRLHASLELVGRVVTVVGVE